MSNRVVTSTVLILLVFVLITSAGITPQGSPSHAPTASHSTVPAIPPRPGSGAGDPGNNSSSMQLAMGITDMGHDQKGNYSYYTTSVKGDASLTDATPTPSNAPFTVQLNSLIVFNASGKRYVYWVQNVAVVNSSRGVISFMNNIWNFSSSHESLNNSSLHGKGEIFNYDQLSYYAYSNGMSFQSLPYNFSLITSVSGNSVLFYYDLGGTITRFDNVSFFSSSPLAIYVSSGYTPTSYRYDLEFVVGGIGDGAAIYFKSFDANLSLSYYNGYNYQSVPSAVNYASNTAETAPNLDASLAHGSDGTLLSHLTLGNNSMSELYSRSGTSTLSVNSTVPGTLYINGSGTSVEFHALLSLYPGTYNVSFVSSLKTVFSEFIRLHANKTQLISIEPRKFAVVFNDSMNISWSVTVGNQTALSTGGNITFDLINGTYNYSVSFTSDRGNSTPYYPFPYSGTVRVEGRNTSVLISRIIPVEVSFHSNYYPISFFVNGYPFTVTGASPVIIPSGHSQFLFYTLPLGYGTVLYPYNSSDNQSIGYDTGNTTNNTFYIYYQTDYLFILNSPNADASFSSDSLSSAGNSSRYLPVNSSIHLTADYVAGETGFGKWIGQGTGNYSGTVPNVTLLLTSPMNETAVYSPLHFVRILVLGPLYGMWGVTVDGRTFTSYQRNITVPLVSGNYTATVWSSDRLSVSPSILTVDVGTSNSSYSVEFMAGGGFIEWVFESILVSSAYSLYLDASLLVIVSGTIIGLAVRRKKVKKQ